MTRTPLALLIGLALGAAAPSLADHAPPSQRYLDQARSELTAIESLARGVRETSTRARLESRIAKLDRLLDQTDRALEEEARPQAITFQEARSAVARESFDSGRLAVIQRLARRGSFTTAEARTLAALCQFESTRADALVALYPAVSDPWRFETALDVLDFSSSRSRVARELGL